MTTRLLISVRDAQEARDALDAGADLIDVKEPRRGALGAADPETLRQIVRAVAGQTPVSAALDELLGDNDSLFATDRAARVPAGVSLAKFGLAGCRELADWPVRLAAAVAALPQGTSGVAVIYADAIDAHSPDADNIIAQGHRAGCAAVLVDTHDKRAGALLDHWALAECERVIDRVHAQGMLAVLAGSLTMPAIARLLPLGPDYVAVRGAACAGARDGALSGPLVRELAELVHGSMTTRDAPTQIAGG